MSNSPVIDTSAIEALKAINPDDGGEFAREIIQIFMEDTPARLEELEEALRRSDATKFVRAAHSIKGSSANVGAMLLRDTAEEIERQARDEGLAGIDGKIEKLRSDYELTALNLTKLL